MLKEDQKRGLRKVFANFPAVKAVYLFGSRAENKETITPEHTMQFNN
jgi:predicted nucleotidyltransferase